MQLFLILRLLLARNSTAALCHPQRDGATHSLRRGALIGAPTRLRPRAFRLRAALHYFLIRNRGQVGISRATARLPTRRRTARDIHGVGHGAITFPGNGSRSTHGASHVEITSPFDRAQWGQAGFRYCRRVGRNRAANHTLNDHYLPGRRKAPATACDFRRRVNSRPEAEPKRSETGAPERETADTRAPKQLPE